MDDCTPQHSEVRAGVAGGRSRHVAESERPSHAAQAWQALAAELGKSPPPAFMLRRAAGVKSAQARDAAKGRTVKTVLYAPRRGADPSSQAVAEVFCWARDPKAVRKIATRKDELFAALLVRQF